MIQVFRSQGFQSLFYWMYVKNKLGNTMWNMVRYVSILVLLDVCKEHEVLSDSGALTPAFQSLFYWMYVKNRHKIYQRRNWNRVSILVLLDVCKEPDGTGTASSSNKVFQSLFYWMYVKNTDRDSLAGDDILSFNPCFIGCM